MSDNLPEDQQSNIFNKSEAAHAQVASSDEALASVATITQFAKQIRALGGTLDIGSSIGRLTTGLEGTVKSLMLALDGLSKRQALGGFNGSDITGGMKAELKPFSKLSFKGEKAVDVNKIAEVYEAIAKGVDEIWSNFKPEDIQSAFNGAAKGKKSRRSYLVEGIKGMSDALEKVEALETSVADAFKGVMHDTMRVHVPKSKASGKAKNAKQEVVRQAEGDIVTVENAIATALSSVSAGLGSIPSLKVAQSRIKQAGSNVKAALEHISNLAEGMSSSELIKYADTKKPKAVVYDVENALTKDNKPVIVSATVERPQAKGKNAVVSLVSSDYEQLLDETFNRTKNPIFSTVKSQIKADLSAGRAEMVSRSDMEKKLYDTFAKAQKAGEQQVTWFGTGGNSDDAKLNAMVNGYAKQAGKAPIAFKSLDAASLFRELVFNDKNSRLKGQDLSSALDITGLTDVSQGMAHGSLADTRGTTRIYALLDELKQFKQTYKKTGQLPTGPEFSGAQKLIDWFSTFDLKAKLADFRAGRDISDLGDNEELIRSMHLNLGENPTTAEIARQPGVDKYAESKRASWVDRVKLRNISKKLEKIASGAESFHNPADIQQSFQNDIFSGTSGVGLLNDAVSASYSSAIPTGESRSARKTASNVLNPLLAIMEGGNTSKPMPAEKMALELPEASTVATKLKNLAAAGIDVPIDQVALAINEQLNKTASNVTLGKGKNKFLAKEVVKTSDYEQGVLSLFDKIYSPMLAENIGLDGRKGGSLVSSEGLSAVFGQLFTESMDVAKANDQYLGKGYVATGGNRANFSIETIRGALTNSLLTLLQSSGKSKKLFSGLQFNQDNFDQHLVRSLQDIKIPDANVFASKQADGDSFLRPPVGPTSTPTSQLGVKNAMGLIAKAYSEEVPIPPEGESYDPEKTRSNRAIVAQQQIIDAVNTYYKTGQVTLAKNNFGTSGNIGYFNQRRNINRGNNYENSAEVKKFLADNNFTPIPVDMSDEMRQKIASGEDTTTNPNEHLLRVGGIPGHPDFLGSRKMGNEQVPYLLDIKSPTLNIPESFDGEKLGLKNLISSNFGGPHTLEWIAQIAGYAQALPGKLRQSLRVGVLAGKPGEEPKLIDESYQALRKGSDIVAKTIRTVESTIAELSKQGYKTQFEQVDRPRHELGPEGKQSDAVLDYFNGLQQEFTITAGKAPAKQARQQLADYITKNRPENASSLNTQRFLEQYMGKGVGENQFPAFMNASGGLVPEFHQLLKQAYPTVAGNEDALISQFLGSVKHTKDNLPSFAKSGGSDAELKFAQEFATLINDERSKEDKNTRDQSIKSKVLGTFNAVAALTGIKRMTSPLSPALHGGDNLDYFNSGYGGRGGDRPSGTPVSFEIDYELQRRIAERHKSSYYSTMVNKSIVDQGDASRNILSNASPRPALKTEKDFNAEDSSEMGATAAFHFIEWQEAQKVVDAYKGIMTALKKQDTKFQAELGDRLISLQNIERQLASASPTEKAKLLSEGANIQSLLASQGVDSSKFVSTDFSAILKKPTGKGSKALKEAIAAQRASEADVAESKENTRLEIGLGLVNKDSGLADYLTKQRNSALHTAQLSTIMLAAVKDDTELPEKQKQSLISRYSSSGQEAIIKAAAIKKFLPETSTERQLTAPSFDTALKGVEDERFTTSQELINKALLSQTAASKFALTPSILKDLTGSTAALHGLGINPADYGINLQSVLKNSKMQGFEPSSSLEAVAAISRQIGSGPAKGEALFQQTDKYINSLISQISGIDSSPLNSTIQDFYTMGKAIEDDILKAQALNTTIKAAEQAGTPINKQDVATRDQHLVSAKAGLRQLQTFQDTRLDTLMGSTFNVSQMADYQPTYDAKKADRLAALQEKARFLSMAIERGDAGTFEDMLPQVSGVTKEARKLGFDISGFKNLNINDILGQLDANKPLASQLGIEGKLSQNATGFVAASQIVNNYQQTGAVRSDINVFESLQAKEQFALKAATELQTKFIQISNIKLGGVENEFTELYKKINADIQALHQLQEEARKSGTELTDINAKKVEGLKTGISSNLDKLFTNQAEMASNRPNLANDENAWKLAVARAQNHRRLKNEELDARALEANALIDAGRQYPGGPALASFEEYDTAIRIAKEREARGMATGGNFYSSKQLEDTAHKSGSPYFKNQQYLSFTEGLVDQAVWKMQWGVAGQILNTADSAFSSFDAAKQFEAQMKNVELVSQASTIQMEDLKTSVTSLSTTFQTSPTELSEGLVILGQAGYKAAESLQLLGPIAQLATATMSNLKQAADITTTVLMSFDQPVANAREVTNSLAAATIESKLELESLGTTLNYVASTAYMAGMSLEETETAMGLMSNAGVRASTIGTSLRSLFGTLLAPTAAFKAELGRIGISVDEVNPKINSMSAILQKLSFKGFNIENAFHGLDKRVAGSMATLLNQSDNWEGFQARVSGTDTASTMAIGQMDTYEAQSKRFNNSIETAKIAAASGSMNMLKSAASVGADALNMLERAAKTSAGQSVTSFVSMAAAMGTVATGFSVLYNAGKVGLPAIGTGVKMALGDALVGEGRFKAFTAESTAGKWLTNRPDTSSMGRQGRIYDTIASMGSVVFNPYAWGGAALLAGGYLGYQHIRKGDEDFMGIAGIGINREKDTLRKVDNLQKYQQVLQAAAKQQFSINYLDRGRSPEVTSFESSLLNTGLYAGKDRFGNLVDINNYIKEKQTYPLSLSMSRSDLDLEAANAAVRTVDQTVNKPKAVSDMFNRGRKEFATVEKLQTPEGQQYLEATVDRAIAGLKSSGDFYNTNRTQQYLNKNFGGNAPFAMAVKGSILEKQEQALKAPNAKDAEQALLKEALINQAEMVRFNELALKGDTAGVGILSKADKARYSSYTQAVGKSLLSDYLTDANFKKAFENSGAVGKEYRSMLDKSDRGEISDAQFFGFIQTASRNMGLKSSSNALEDYNKRRTEIISPKTLAEQKDKLAQLGQEFIYLNPEKAASRESYSTAKAKFAETSLADLSKYMNTSKLLATAQSELTAAEQEYGKSSDVYKQKQAAVTGLQVVVDQLAIKLRQLGEDAMRYVMPDVSSSNREFLRKGGQAVRTMQTPEVGNVSMLNAVPSYLLGDYSDKIDQLKAKYSTLQADDIVKNNPRATARLNLAFKLEMEDITEELVSKSNEKAIKYSSVIKDTFKTVLDNTLTISAITLDIKKLDIDLESSERLKAQKTSPRQQVAGIDRGILDWSPRGFPYQGPYPNVYAFKPQAGLLDIPKYSKDTEYLNVTDTQQEKIAASKSKVRSDLEAQLSQLKQTFDQSKKEVVETTGSKSETELTPLGKKRLLDEEEKYAQGRVAANQKAFSSIRQILEEEIKLRDQLINKMAEAENIKADMAKTIDSETKSLLKAAGMDTRTSPSKLQVKGNELLDEGRKAAKAGDLDKFQQIFKAFQEVTGEAKTEEYSPYMRAQLAKISEQFGKLLPETVTNNKKNLGERLATTENSIGNLSNPSDIKTYIANALEAAKAQGLITAEKQAIYTQKYNQQIEANAGDPAVMASIIADFNKTPVLNKGIGEISNVDETFRYLTEVVSSAAPEMANLGTATTEATTALMNLVSELKGFAGNKSGTVQTPGQMAETVRAGKVPNVETAKDVTPSKSALESLLGPAYKELGLDKTSNAPQLEIGSKELTGNKLAAFDENANKIMLRSGNDTTSAKHEGFHWWTKQQEANGNKVAGNNQDESEMLKEYGAAQFAGQDLAGFGIPKGLNIFDKQQVAPFIPALMKSKKADEYKHARGGKLAYNLSAEDYEYNNVPNWMRKGLDVMDVALPTLGFAVGGGLGLIETVATGGAATPVAIAQTAGATALGHQGAKTLRRMVTNRQMPQINKKALGFKEDSTLGDITAFTASSALDMTDSSARALMDTSLMAMGPAKEAAKALPYANYAEPYVAKASKFVSPAINKAKSAYNAVDDMVIKATSFDTHAGYLPFLTKFESMGKQGGRRLFHGVAQGNEKFLTNPELTATGGNYSGTFFATDDIAFAHGFSENTASKLAQRRAGMLSKINPKTGVNYTREEVMNLKGFNDKTGGVAEVFLNEDAKIFNPFKASKSEYKSIEKDLVKRYQQTPYWKPYEEARMQAAKDVKSMKTGDWKTLETGAVKDSLKEQGYAGTFMTESNSKAGDIVIDGLTKQDKVPVTMAIWDKSAIKNISKLNASGRQQAFAATQPLMTTTYEGITRQLGAGTTASLLALSTASQARADQNISYASQTKARQEAEIKTYKSTGLTPGEIAAYSQRGGTERQASYGSELRVVEAMANRPAIEQVSTMPEGELKQHTLDQMQKLQAIKMPMVESTRKVGNAEITTYTDQMFNEASAKPVKQKSKYPELQKQNMEVLPGLFGRFSVGAEEPVTELPKPKVTDLVPPVLTDTTQDKVNSRFEELKAARDNAKSMLADPFKKKLGSDYELGNMSDEQLKAKAVSDISAINKPSGALPELPPEVAKKFNRGFKTADEVLKATDSSVIPGVTDKTGVSKALQFNLSDKAPVGKLAEVATASEAAPKSAESLLASNEKLIASLDNLKSAIDQMKGTSNTTSKDTGAQIGVTVQAPVTLNTTNGGGTTADIESKVTKVVKNIFDSEFSTRLQSELNNGKF